MTSSAKGNPLGISENDIVISGMSGRLPESNNIEEFAKNLFDGVDMVTEDDRRWASDIRLPKRNGKLKDLAHFDAAFFGVHPKQADLMDPQMRLLLETTYEAIVDAGLNPVDLRGSRTSCCVCVSNLDTGILWSNKKPANFSGYGIMGCMHSMFANRISNFFDLKGPAYAIDSGCSSASLALTQAVTAIRNGLCDSAFVAGTNLCLYPDISEWFKDMGILSAEGRCATFDASGNGYARSEAIVVILMQRRANARRIYATVRGARSNNDGYKMEGITFPASNVQGELATETFEEAHLRTQDVAYLEAHGTGTEVGDLKEGNTISDVFCKDRKTPLLVGSVKSNMGHPEPAAGLCAIVKVLIAMERGVIPGNLHYKTPNKRIPALEDGRIKIVDRNTPWDGGLVAVNSFGMGGTNAHIILDSEPNMPRLKRAAYTLPRLVLASGRSVSAVRALLTHATVHADDADLHALLDAVHAHNIRGHAHRGYALLTKAPVEEIVTLKNIDPQPVWFVFSGIGSVAPHMARDLMQVPIFAASVQRAAVTLQPHGVDLLHVLTDASEAAFEDIINTFVSIVAVQIALVDLLRAVGVHPDGIIGHSVGELGAAYADETLTAEQTILAAYWRGRSILDAKLAPGAMAVVGLTWEQCVARCPPDIVPACHNSEYSVTISGPETSIEKFISDLTKQGTFARRISTNGIAFHSKYIEPAGPLLRAHLEALIPCPKSRSARWISSSLSKDQSNLETAKLSDAEYHVNNLLSPVRFAEAMRSVPANAVLVELAPQSHMQAVLKRILSRPESYVPLVCRKSHDAALHLLSALGKIYCMGAQVHPGALYPSVAWPVRRGTPGLGSHVLWDHSTKWSVAKHSNTRSDSSNVIEVDLSKPDNAFLAGHEIDGRILFPATGYIMLVWKTIAKYRHKKFMETAVVLDDLQLRRATIISRDTPVNFFVNIHDSTGVFDVSVGGEVAVTGKVRLAEDRTHERLSMVKPIAHNEPELLPLTADDVYKDLRLRGYNYAGVFCGIKSVNESCTIGKLNWNGNWISFMDTMLQLKIVSEDIRELQLPMHIQRVVIDPVAHLAAVGNADIFTANICKEFNLITSGGIEFRGVKVTSTPRRLNPQPQPKLEKYTFVPYVNTVIQDKLCIKRDALTVSLQLVLENAGTLNIKIMEMALDHPVDTLLTPHVLQVFEVEPQVQVNCFLVVRSTTLPRYAVLRDLGVQVIAKDVNGMSLDSSHHVVLATQVLAQHGDLLKKLALALADTGMLLLKEPHGVLDCPTSVKTLERAGLLLVSRQVTVDCDYVLLKRQTALPTQRVVIEIDEEYRWFKPLRAALKRAQDILLRVYLVSYASDSGVLGLLTSLRTAPGGHALRIFYIPQARDYFSLTSPVYADQLTRDQAVNVLRSDVWGSYRYLLLGDTNGAQLPVEHAYVNSLVHGDLSSLRWIESPLRYAHEQQWPEHTELCHVYYAPLNFRDVMLAIGKLPSDALLGSLAGNECILGMEFSGRSLDGKRVMGMVEARALATTVIADKGFLWEIPETWTLEQAATVPVAYTTAYYALLVRGHMRRGEAVLIHEGTSDVGQAAITIALHAGCIVFTTVDAPNKREFLHERFPALEDTNIGSSRDLSFEQMVHWHTNGRGVDLVVNSLDGDQLLASVRCLAKGGRFLEIGKLDLSSNKTLDMALFLKNTTFHGILLDSLFEMGDENADKVAVARCMSAGLADGSVQPLPSTVFRENQLERSFRYMATGKYIGKVLLRIREEEDTPGGLHSKLVSAVPRTYFHPAKSYVLIGGLGGVGLELARWLVKRGATRLVFNSRRGLRTGYQAACIRTWRAAGVNVVVSTADASTINGARHLLHEAATLGPIGGIFNLAAVLHVALLENQKVEDFKCVVKPKIECTKALDEVTRELAPELDYFVVFSSVTTGRGSPNLSSYAFANSGMERICEQRQADGLPGLAIQWGPIGEVGLVPEKLGRDYDNHALLEMVPQCISSCMEALDVLLSSPHAVTSCMVPACKQRVSWKPQQDPVHVVANVLGIQNPKNTHVYTSLTELGMDSLMLAEIKQTFERSFKLALSVHEIRSLTFSKLQEMTLNIISA